MESGMCEDIELHNHIAYFLEMCVCVSEKKVHVDLYTCT